ncbi:DUF6745 domain-containing protein [Streptomyces capillispiralis]|uniref:DUF6745 domain-containing protein n=1 Tax=Streptomyces capillispiralis TaxID=68182 RepID=A0A561TRD9_9ACTN|nr:hypothetical protein [Streptomyces capillispiralis]TWF89658.1 hypothetical protein FHX78_116701 [Streptomyces capillispiralis]GHH93977.1 hypothetical protein GCM10017779_44340 [Streptomyces capillispiralis]
MTITQENGTAAVAGGPEDAAGGDRAEETARWRASAVAAVPADRAAAEEGIRLAYRSAGLAGPERVVWAGSPREGVTLIRRGTDFGASVREAVRTAPWAAERRRLHEELGAAGWSRRWAETGGALWDATQALVDRIRAGVLDDLAEDDPAARTEIGLVLLDALLGQHDAPWLAALDTDGSPLAGPALVCRSAGWWWPFEKVAVVCERPVALHRDEAGRLDHGDGPALEFPDGFALCAWRGMPVTRAFLDELRTLTPERIRQEDNAELRRVMLEYYGYDRYLSDSGAQPLHRDGTGTLWRIALPDDEPVVMVEVLNSTPEPDGTHRTYWLRVPPATRTAREGVAWTFGLDAEVYEPLKET